MIKLRTHFTLRVDTWTPDGESIVEHVAGVEDYQVALATYPAACERWLGVPITVRQGAAYAWPGLTKAGKGALGLPCRSGTTAAPARSSERGTRAEMGL